MFETMSEGDRLPAGVDDLSEELRLLIENVVDYAIFVLSPTGEIRSWNAGAERALGYRADEVIGSNLSRFYTLEDAWRVGVDGRGPREEFPGARAKSFRAWAARFLLPMIENQL